jgi:predicted amidohydrolase YtcJ
VRKKILFTNGSVFDGSGFLPSGTMVLVSDGRIADVGTADQTDAGGAEVVDLDGGTLLPGFIDSRTPDPADGRIERDADGTPVGMLQEGAMLLVTRLLPPVTDEDRYLGLLAGQEYYLSLGITGWQDAIVGPGFGADDVTGAYLRAAGDGTLTVSVTAARWWQRHGGLEQLDELLHHRAEDAIGRFRPTSVKLMLDGVAENHTAAMLGPYLDGHGCATDNSGLDFIDPVELRRYVTELDSHGFQAHFHAMKSTSPSPRRPRASGRQRTRQG